MNSTSQTLTELLRAELAKVPSIRAVARATGLTHVSLVRFLRGMQSLRLDMADRLAQHFRIEHRRRVRREKSERVNP